MSVTTTSGGFFAGAHASGKIRAYSEHAHEEFSPAEARERAAVLLKAAEEAESEPRFTEEDVTALLAIWYQYGVSVRVDAFRKAVEASRKPRS